MRTVPGCCSTSSSSTNSTVVRRPLVAAAVAPAAALATYTASSSAIAGGTSAAGMGPYCISAIHLTLVAHMVAFMSWALRELSDCGGVFVRIGLPFTAKLGLMVVVDLTHKTDKSHRKGIMGL